MKSWLEVSEERLTGNYRVLVGAAGGGTGVLAVVKANAYGHGARVCAPVLARAGAEWLGVTDVAEGVEVREALAAAGLEAEVLVMSGLLGEDAEAMVRHRMTAVVWERHQMEWLAAAAARQSEGPVPIHLEIDTGMGRQGVSPGEGLDAVLRWLKGQQRLRLDGVMMHFASAETAGSSQTVEQRRRFEVAMAAVAASGLRPVWVHAGNSSTIDNQGAEENLAWLRRLAATVGARSMVRSGLGLYGYCLPIESAEGGDLPAAEVQPFVLPAMSWKTRVTGLRGVERGDLVGYNGTFRAQRPMRLALLPDGYADGLRRELSGTAERPGGWVMVAGQRAAIAGRVSMNLTVVDVTGIAGIAVGDEVVVLGEGVTAEDHARLAGTIAYEILCGMRAAPHLVRP